MEQFAQSQKRVEILKGWFAHRNALRQAGFEKGYQWLDGSFVEDKEPNDLDVVTFLYFGPQSFANIDSAWLTFDQNAGLFDRTNAKRTFSLDAFFVDLLDPIELVIETARYWLGLFSHLTELEQLLPPAPPLPPLTLSLFETGGFVDAP